jgi:hypothetical protein
MATLVINDLPESVELDAQAMAAVTGGARIRGQGAGLARRHLFTGLDSRIAAAAANEGRETAPRGPVQTLLFAQVKSIER